MTTFSSSQPYQQEYTWSLGGSQYCSLKTQSKSQMSSQRLQSTRKLCSIKIQNHLKAPISSLKRVMRPSTLIVARSALSLTLTQTCSTQRIHVKHQVIKSILRGSIYLRVILVHKYTVCRRKKKWHWGKEDLHFQSRPLVHLRQECSWIGLLGLPVPARFIGMDHATLINSKTRQMTW